MQKYWRSRYSFIAAALPSQKETETRLWLKCLQVTSCEKVTTLARFPPPPCLLFHCFLFYLRQGHSLFPSPAVFDRTRPRRAILNSSLSTTKAKQREELFPSHSNVCKGWRKTANHPVSIFSPTIVSQPRDHGHARGGGGRARPDTSDAPVLLVSVLKSGGLLFLPRMFTAGITRQVWLSGSFTAEGGKPRHTQISER